MSSLPTKPPPPPRPKTRGSYNCGRCGQPKKGHVCNLPDPGGIPSPSPSSSGPAASASAGDNRLRRALSFDEASASATPSSPEKKPRVLDEDGDDEMADYEEEEKMELGGRAVPTEVVVEVLRRLGPRGVLEVAAVSRGWRDCADRVWRAAEELRLRPAGGGLVGVLLPRCTALSRLVLHMER
jgi:hypothetical protein